MQNKLNPFIPILTTQAGACLTLANWQEIGIHTVAYYLDVLLMKPGYSLLNALPNLQGFCGWPGTIVLNATMSAANSLGRYTLRSRYDGSLQSISQDELVALICHLQPDIVILPPGFASYLAAQHLSLPKAVMPFIPASEFPQVKIAEAGIYLAYETTQPFASFLSQFQQYGSIPTYLAGAFNFLQAQELIKQGAYWLESDKPASDALLGEVYGEEDNLRLLDSDMANQHKPIAAGCSCPTCMQGLTRAYLHHLLIQTPLLAQRFLIQHNAYYEPTSNRKTG